MILSTNWPDLVKWVQHAEVVVTVMTTLVGALAGLLTAVLLLYKKLRELQAELTRTNSVVAKVAQGSGSPSAIEAAERLPQPAPEKVGEWARDHHAKNAWDMGPKNWERCLYDLGYRGGKEHTLQFDQDGHLIYQ